MIKGKNIDLRLVKEEEVPVVNELFSDILGRGEYYPIGFRSLVSEKKRYEESGFWSQDMGWLLVTDKGNRILGTLGFFKTAPYVDGYELGAIIYKEEDRGKGYITEAVKIFVAYLFEAKKIERLQATLIAGNKGSEGVFRKVGLKKEGVMRSAVFHRGKHKDVEMYSILRSEVKSLEETLKDL